MAKKRKHKKSVRHRAKLKAKHKKARKRQRRLK
jgi:hypothetical protein